jgi:hypothetical protein
MIFILGVIVGILIATLIFAILAFFRAGIEKRVKIIETRLASAGPKVRGAIYMPESEEEEARQEIIRKNRAMGKDTPISELQ